MNKKILGLVIGLVVILSAILLLINYSDELSEIVSDGDTDVQTSDVINEIDESLLEEDDEIEIGEII